MYPSTYAHLNREYHLPTTDSVAPERHRRPRRGFREMVPVAALKPRRVRPRPAGPGYQPCE